MIMSDKVKFHIVGALSPVNCWSSSMDCLRGLLVSAG